MRVRDESKNQIKTQWAQMSSEYTKPVSLKQAKALEDSNNNLSRINFTSMRKNHSLSMKV